MFISIDKNGKLALREPDDFKRLHIEVGDDVTREQTGRALEPIATADGDNFWIDVDALKQLGRAGGDRGLHRTPPDRLRGDAQRHPDRSQDRSRPALAGGDGRRAAGLARTLWRGRSAHRRERLL